MEISKFIRELQAISPNWLQMLNADEQIYSFRPYPSTSKLINNMLYIGRLSRLLPLATEERLNFLCIDDQNGGYDRELLLASFPNCNIVLTSHPIQFQKLCDLSTEIFLAETKYTSYINHMMVAANMNKGPQYLVDEAFKLLKSPIVIIDTSYKVIAMYNGIKIESRPDLDTQREIGYITEQTLQRMKQDKIYEKLRASKYPSYDKPKTEQYGWMTILVYIHGIEVAQIAMMEYDHPFTSYDFEFLNFFSQLISWEMQKNDFYKNNRGIMHSVFLSELLDRKIPNQRIVKLRKEQLNWNDAPCLYVFTVFDNDATDFSNKAQILAYQLQHILPNSRYAIYDGKLVLLLQQNDEDISPFLEGGLVDECLESNQLTGILSNCFSNLLDIRKFYDQTLKVHELRQIISEQRNIYFYSDYMFYHIGQIISEAYDLKDFYHPALNKVMDYDAKNNTNFLDTLKEYLLHVDNPTLCAKNLYIHKNTFFYRMNKIRELFHLDFSNGMERMRLHLTLEFLKLAELTEEETLRKGKKN
ncbi:MAG TPA: PucR family transcriptional regulator [Clostridiales bacterium]|nr:PucR family transcriptional regulator [Clostridiales bacterium]